MRYNKQELVALASQTSQNFDREGVLVVREKQDGFFRRSEGSSVRWFRLRGNLLFYLKGPEPWYEPMGVIVLGQHQVKVQSQDENGHWPFQILWDNGVCYRMATFHETERTLWLKAIQLASYESIHTQLAALKDRLNRIRPTVDIDTHRLQKGVVVDMNEVPLCELALSCDNLLCDAHGRPPSPMAVLYVKNPKSQCIRYGTTEVVETCSNPCFSRTIMFRASDGLAGDTLVRIVLYDVREPVSDTAVPMGFTSLKLTTIQEAQRLRVALVTRDNKTVGFVTINGWSLEPSYIGTSPIHNTTSIDLQQKVLCHRRSQSLPPRLGVKLKFPSYSSLIKQNFVNSFQVTYRFHSGLGGDITVHEVMAEPKICYTLPAQLLNIYIQRERELLEELLSVADICGQWPGRQVELVGTHVSLLKHYCHVKRCMQGLDNTFFKASSRKDDPSLEFAPINLHLQRMWVHNDTLNKTGFHDVITVGAFAAHTHKAERTGGLIRLVQQVKDINSPKAEMSSITNKIHAEYDNVVAVRRLRDEINDDMDRVLMIFFFLNLSAVKSKVKSMLTLWDPYAVEDSLSYISCPKSSPSDDPENQTMSTVVRLTDQLSMFDTISSDCDTFDASSGSSSKETSPTGDLPTFSSSVPNIDDCSANAEAVTEGAQLHFHHDYFKCEREERSSLNHSFRSFRSVKLNEQSLSFDSTKTRHGSLRYDFRCSASLEQVSYRCLVDNVGTSDKKKSTEVPKAAEEQLVTQLDQVTRDNNLVYLKGVATHVEDTLTPVLDTMADIMGNKNGICTDDELDTVRLYMDRLRTSTDAVARWLRLSHAALRLREDWFALTSTTAGLVCWLSSVPGDVIVKVLSSGLGPLCGFEGLLSLYSTEKAMWGDMVVAVEDLQTVVFTLTKVGHSGTRGALKVHLPVSDSLYARFTSKEHLSFTITAVFFNVGINEKATLAEALGETTPQYHSNSDNLDRLNKYYLKHNKTFPPDPMAANRASSRTKPLEEVMENLRISVHKKTPRNVEILHLAALATRLMNGIRFTSCKSAKDRTGMSVTLEQGSILASEYHLAEHEVKKALNIMRSEGCRRENTYKNIGTRKYAFTKKQVMALPEEYRPPPGTYGSSHT
ncbi:hypothetical protein O3G_MSEX003496 [Manduca sexta]|uniref:Phosphatidylinositol-3,4-bisphosphate 4-phosphatase n=1 Tax=Manduca sexta TaxID=7130 RepID=A0A921YU06_MANSE|nr:hypothetical protein O3G_MSEX003496 [Manduca sexta]